MNRIPAKNRLPLLALVILALQACSGGPFDPGQGRAELRAARARWERQGISDYRYTIIKACGECMPESVAPARVEVRGGRTVSVEALFDARPIRREFFDAYDTVEDLFAVIEATLAENPYRFHASYDRRRGHPLSYSVDYDRQMVDDEGGFTVADFEIIQ
ncbi:MAG TPA: DUF6174 domain-containing protein [Longimicrobiaceae bacterium]|nr:DUF6174 domain-containing protein [Longimicrobiaceae bacterium]